MIDLIDLINSYVDFIVYCVGNSAIIVIAFCIGRVYEGNLREEA